MKRRRIAAARVAESVAVMGAAKRGRPAIGADTRIELRVAPELRAQAERDAARLGLTLTDWIRGAMLRRLEPTATPGEPRQ